jgi:uncharacterized protein
MKHLVFIGLMLVLPLAAAVEDPANLEQLRAAAAKGEIEAEYELGILYEFGFQFPDHKAAAYAWYARAADHGHVKAAERRDALRGSLSAAEMEKAPQLIPPLVTAPAPTADAEPAPASTP